MRDVYIIGVHTIKFGKYLENGVKELVGRTVEGVLKDAGVDRRQLQSAWFSNSGWGMRNFQHCIRGQVAFRPLGIEGIPITNVENACAGGSTAFHGAWKDVALGLSDLSLAAGGEKVYDPNKYMVFASFMAGMDVTGIVDMMEQAARSEAATARPPAPAPAPVGVKKPKKPQSLRDRVQDYWYMFTTYILLRQCLGADTLKKLRGMGTGGEKSSFMDVYGYSARQHMAKYGSTQRQMAAIASKNHWHSSLNPNAQYTFEVSIDEVMADRIVSYPLTRAMCAPIGDGSASAILASEEMVKRLGVTDRAVKVRASVLVSGRTRGEDDADIAERASKIAYERAGLGPGDIQLAEVHDATAFGELHQTEALGFFAPGEGGVHAEAGETKIGGRRPINPSGGLLSRGHPIGASGLAQLHELVTQLRGEAGKRQVAGARIALAENGGGVIGIEEAAMCIHILEKM